MKLRATTVVKFTAKLEKGTYIRLQDSLDMHNGVHIVEMHDDFNIILKSVKTGKYVFIKSMDDLSRYDFEIGTMRMEFIPEEQKETLKEPIRERTKEECEKATDEFAENLRKRLEELYGSGIGVQFYGV